MSLRPSGVVAPDELEAIKENRRSQTVGLSSLQLHRRAGSGISISLGGCAAAARARRHVCRCRGQHHRRTLVELYPRIQPSIGNKAIKLTGCRAAYANARAKELLGWKPVYSWRND